MNGLVNSSLFSPLSVANLKQTFDANEPIRHVIIDNFLSPEFTKRLFESFPALADMKTHYRGLNEKKSESSDFSKLHPDFEKITSCALFRRIHTMDFGVVGNRAALHNK